MAPPPACCPPESEPLLIMSDYEPTGELVLVDGGLSCYVAKPQEHSSSAVIVFTDMFGLHTGRHKQICDNLASEGFLVICPDFFKDNPYLKNTPNWGMTLGCACEFICGLICKSFAKKTQSHAWDVSMRAKLEGTVVPWLHSQGARKFASVGFCWGAYGVMKCCTLPDFICGIHFHPSVEFFCKTTGEDALAMCRALTAPLAVVASKGEPDSWKPNGVAQAACEEAMPGEIAWRVESEMKHGYMTRGDTTKPEVLEAVKRGMQQMIELFKKYAS